MKKVLFQRNKTGTCFESTSKGKRKTLQQVSTRNIVLCRILLIVFVCLLPVVQGCTTLGGSGTVKRQAANGLTPILSDFHDVAMRCDDLGILKTTLEAYILLVETLIQESPKNTDLMVFASRLYAYYSFGFVVHEDLERGRKLYWKGIAWGKQALKLNRSVKEALDQGEPLYKCIPHLRPGKDVPAAFVTGLNQGMLLICSLDQPEAFGEANAFRALTEWVVEQEDNYFFGGARSLLGVYFGLMPPMAGGGADKARKEFDRSIEINPDFLLHYYLFARYVPTLIDDEPLFDKLVKHVQEADSAVDPRYAALNEIAKFKMKLLEEDRYKYFY